MSRHASPQPGELPHLKAALVAVGLWVVIVTVLGVVSRRQSLAHIEQIGPLILSRKTFAVELQRAAFEDPALLPVYGSSELIRESDYRAAEFFARFPTGFAVSPVGARGTETLETLAELASVGEGLRNRRVVVILTPLMFTAMPVLHAGYIANFSRLQTGEAVFNSRLDNGFKQQLARRLLAFPEVLERDAFLRVTLEGLAAVDWRRWFLNGALQLLGRLQNAALEAGDQAIVLTLLWTHPEYRRPATRHAARLDWDALKRDAEARYARSVPGHAFGFLEDRWNEESGDYRRLKGVRSDEEFLRSLRTEPRWEDLDLLFRLLHTFGARTLVLSIPFPGDFMDYWGVSASARQKYHQRLRALTATYAIECLTFEEREYEPLLLKDSFQHPTSKAWVVFDSVLNAFYHDTLR